MKILGIETSCDETAAAMVENGTKILSNVVASSVEMHAKVGGIIPEVAAREQVRCIIPVIEETISRATPPIDAIAVTVGPGLIGSLLVGVETAKTLSYVWEKPLIPINHLVGHIYANWLTPENKAHSTKDIVPEFPALTLVVSGGHTDLVLMKDHGQIKWLGGTRDDAAGECFDKCARLLGLGYPGGPAISAAAKKFQIPASPAGGSNFKYQIKLPRPMINENNFDFSFSGLKTAVFRQAQNKLSDDKKTVLAYEIQEAATDVLVAKTLRAAEKYKVKSILLAGGVSANSRLRKKMQQAIRNKQYALYIPEPKLCTDNAAYIASCAYFNYKPVSWQKITTLPGLTIAGAV